MGGKMTKQEELKQFIKLKSPITGCVHKIKLEHAYGYLSKGFDFVN